MGKGEASSKSAAQRSLLPRMLSRKSSSSAAPTSAQNDDAVETPVKQSSLRRIQSRTLSLSRRKKPREEDPVETAPKRGVLLRSLSMTRPRSKPLSGAKDEADAAVPETPLTTESMATTAPSSADQGRPLPRASSLAHARTRVIKAMSFDRRALRSKGERTKEAATKLEPRKEVAPTTPDSVAVATEDLEKAALDDELPRMLTPPVLRDPDRRPLVRKLSFAREDAPERASPDHDDASTSAWQQAAGLPPLRTVYSTRKPAVQADPREECGASPTSFAPLACDVEEEEEEEEEREEEGEEAARRMAIHVAYSWLANAEEAATSPGGDTLRAPLASMAADPQPSRPSASPLRMEGSAAPLLFGPRRGASVPLAWRVHSRALLGLCRAELGTTTSDDVSLASE